MNIKIIYNNINVCLNLFKYRSQNKGIAEDQAIYDLQDDHSS